MKRSFEHFSSDSLTSTSSGHSQASAVVPSSATTSVVSNGTNSSSTSSFESIVVGEHSPTSISSKNPSNGLFLIPPTISTSSSLSSQSSSTASASSSPLSPPKLTQQLFSNAICQLQSVIANSTTPSLFYQNAIRQILASTFPQVYSSNNNISRLPPTTVPYHHQVTVSVIPSTNTTTTNNGSSNTNNLVRKDTNNSSNFGVSPTPSRLSLSSQNRKSFQQSSSHSHNTEVQPAKRVKLTTLTHHIRPLPYCIKLLILSYIELPILQYVEFRELPHPFNISQMDHTIKLRRQMTKLIYGYFSTDVTRSIHLLFSCIDYTTHCQDSTHNHHNLNDALSEGSTNSGNSNSIRSPPQSSFSHCPLETIKLSDKLDMIMFRSKKFVSLRFSDCNLRGEEMKCLSKQGDCTRITHLKTIDLSKNHNFSTNSFKHFLSFPDNNDIPATYPNLTYLNLLETSTDASCISLACKAFPKLQILKHSFSSEHVVEYNSCVKALASLTHLQQLHLECTSGYYEMNMKELLQSKSLKKIALFGFQFSDNNVNINAFRYNESLKKLSLTNCFIATNREKVAESISSSTSIRELIFSEINLENSDIQLFSERMDKLQTLIIGGSDAFHMNTTGFTNFHMLKGLQKFVIDGFSDYCTLNFETCKAFCLSNLTFLELDGFQEADDSYLALMLRQGVNLKALKVKQTKINCRDNALADALRNHKCLRHLKLDENEAIGDAGVLFLNNNLPSSLVKLGLTMCNISDIGAKALLANKQIRKLKVKMNNITDESLKLLKFNTSLIYISIDALRSEEMVRIIGEDNKTLKQLSVISIPVTETTIESLTKNTSLHYLKIKNCDHLNRDLKQRLIDRASFGVIFRGIFSEEAFL
ncbi:predicted protein [Naegleria gruberi]|uniref:Predicted protein n=1 Tax=Naegleria gruberi TaxID=5762 RepID=D2V8M9_NAEGR|nr:uncharacterized protein NAEGRDRAFT_79017 [Naegleria gruberi]EFC46717.1 predicted protein [Naegleria gruberi]|eukprot:XP_002679461.1 predicted protein [Naegleria gruberi strain NEG-M]